MNWNELLISNNKIFKVCEEFMLHALSYPKFVFWWEICKIELLLNIYTYTNEDIKYHVLLQDDLSPSIFTSDSIINY